MQLQVPTEAFPKRSVLQLPEEPLTKRCCGGALPYTGLELTADGISFREMLRAWGGRNREKAIPSPPTASRDKRKGEGNQFSKISGVSFFFYLFVRCFSLGSVQAGLSCIIYPQHETLRGTSEGGFASCSSA